MSEPFYLRQPTDESARVHVSVTLPGGKVIGNEVHVALDGLEDHFSCARVLMQLDNAQHEVIRDVQKHFTDLRDAREGRI